MATKSFRTLIVWYTMIFILDLHMMTSHTTVWNGATGMTTVVASLSCPDVATSRVTHVGLILHIVQVVFS